MWSFVLRTGKVEVMCGGHVYTSIFISIFIYYNLISVSIFVFFLFISIFLY